MQNINTNLNPDGVEIRIRGTVQGVGFRPFVYNLARRLGIRGSVSNSGDGVRIKATAFGEVLDAFSHALQNEAPALAVISAMELSALDPELWVEDFSIEKSSCQSAATATIPPDVALCEDCASEMLDLEDRRYLYPFTNCTNCGPRFTIVRTVPYDRPGTSMDVFAMCESCRSEYDNPGDRRFHAQPNACPDCGPRASLHGKDGTELQVDSALERTATLLGEGRVLAIKGLGGFHLCVDAFSAAAISLLRERKRRPDKALAIMVRDLATVQKYCHLEDMDKDILLSHAHPIVLLPEKQDSGLSELLAPGLQEIGVMLPYTPLHRVLFMASGCPEALVMTSGNRSGVPICTGNQAAFAELSEIADYFLIHNREIVTRVDDSVVRHVAGELQTLRRARGYTPAPVAIPWHLPRLLACGPGLKNTFCFARQNNLYPSQHIGDLDSLEASQFYGESIEHWQRLYQLEAEAVVCDLHPDYPSSHYAKDTGLPLYRVQHHHAHAVAVMAEHGLQETVLAIVLDGSGLGEDGAIWGGEILEAGLMDCRRLGHLSYFPLPGGDKAATQPWRMALSLLSESGGGDPLSHGQLPRSLQWLEEQQVSVISAMLAAGVNCSPSSSCGRLFDGVASLLGLCQRISYEGQAAMELEALAGKAAESNWYEEILPVPRGKTAFYWKEGYWQISCSEFATMILRGLESGANRAHLALRFHVLLLRALSSLVLELADARGIRQVVLTGGCMQNRLLLEGFFHALTKGGLQVFTGNRLPINDGGVSVGQAIIGGLRHVSSSSNEGLVR